MTNLYGMLIPLLGAAIGIAVILTVQPLWMAIVILVAMVILVALTALFARSFDPPQ